MNRQVHRRNGGLYAPQTEMPFIKRSRPKSALLVNCDYSYQCQEAGGEEMPARYMLVK